MSWVLWSFGQYSPFYFFEKQHTAYRCFSKFRSLFEDGDLQVECAAMFHWMRPMYIYKSMYGYKYVIRLRSFRKWELRRFSNFPNCLEEMGINRAGSGGMVFHQSPTLLRGKPFSHYFSILNLFPCPGWLNLSAMCQAKNLVSPLSLEIITSSHFHGLFWNGDLSFVFLSQLK